MIKDFKAIKISLASPQQILGWSHGEVKKAETINYRTNKAEVDGLMDEKIFGPIKNYECYCGKYKKIRYKGIVCDKCGVEVTNKRVRRERMGHITLASPVAHVWFSYGVPNKLSLILGVPQKQLETVIYFARYIVTSVDNKQKQIALEKINELKKSELENIKKERIEALDNLDKENKAKINELNQKNIDKDKKEMQLSRLTSKYNINVAKIKSIYSQKIEKINEKYNINYKLIESIKIGTTLSEEDYNRIKDIEVTFFNAGMGAESIKILLEKMNVDQTINDLKNKRDKTKSVMKKRKINQRLRIIEGIRQNNIKPEWIILTHIPVLPPDLRPIIQLPGGRFATSDLNDLYRRLINRNNRLKRLINLGAPEIILRNEKRMLQEAVDALIDNSHRPGNPVLNSRGQPYKSLSDMLRGKQGRFRQNLLGKRVDYSGRSVIVVGPDINIYQCGIPKTIALELFKPFIIREIIADGLAPNIKSAKHFYESKSSEVWDILERVIKNRPVFLNRAPTLHKQGIQAFFPVLVEGNAIKLHPMMCKGFNADFDGDQMAVHLPLSQKAIEEALEHMFANSNILKMADGSPVIGLEKDMALGIYYMTTIDNEENTKATKAYSSPNEAIGQFEAGRIGLREKIKVLINDELVDTSVGRLKFNENFPKGVAFINKPVNKKEFAKLSARILNNYGGEAVIELFNKIEPDAFRFATLSGISIGMDDFVISENKDKLLAQIEKKETQLTKDYYNGLLTEEEKRRLSEEAWMTLVDKVAEDTWQTYKKVNNHLVTLNDSGALPLENPLRQISGVRGLILDPLGRIVELPLRSNYKQGLTTLEYFVAARGTRKGLADTALKTAESGYLTRKLVDVAQGVITKKEDCGTTEGIYIYRNSDRRLDFVDRISGRIAASDIVDEKTGEILIKNGEEITQIIAEKINKSAVDRVYVRSVLKCLVKDGVCQKCYGYSLGTRRLVELGIAVGVIAAQSMGEAATQLTLDTKHLSGRAGTDITQGLPRVEELFEVRTPKGKAIISEIAGKVKIEHDKETELTVIQVISKKKLQKIYKKEKGDKFTFKRAKKVHKGELLITRKTGEKIESEDEGKVNIEGNKIILNIDKELKVEYIVPDNAQIIINDGDIVTAGQALTSGSIDPKELMIYSGLDKAQEYIIDNIQKTYGIQGIAIDDKHVEVIVKQMSRYVKITNAVESEFLPGDFVDYLDVIRKNEELTKAGKKPISFIRVLIGITTASIKTESFLSAASFQDQVRVLSEGAILGKVDNLIGLKENVIIGRPVPLGSEAKLSE